MCTRFEREAATTLRGVLLVVLALLAVISYGALLRLTFTSTYRGANDFYIPWRATQALLWEGRDPYGPEVTAEIQRTLFGRTRRPDEHQFDFAYPLTVAIVLAPYTLVPYEWAQPLWQATLHLLLVGGVLLWLRAWRPILPRPLPLGGLILWALSIYPAARAFLLGQVALVVLAAIVVALWALAHGRHRTAGVALALATVKPQLSFLVVPALLFLAWTGGRRRVLWSFGASGGVLLALSLALMPRWPVAFLQRLVEYQRYTNLGTASDSPSPLALFVRPLGPAAALVGAFLALALLGLLLWSLWRQRRAPDWPLVGSVLLSVGAWIAPRAATTDQTLLLLPLIFLLDRVTFQKVGAEGVVHAAEPRPQPPSPRIIESLPRLIAVTIAGLLWGGLWLLFLATVQGDQEQLVVRLPLPLAVLALWLWTARTRHRETAGDLAPHR